MVQQITRHTVQSGLKYGMTSDDFCAKYQCTNGEFEQCINRLFRRNAEGIFSRLRDNARSQSRNSNPKCTDGNPDPPPISRPTIPSIRKNQSLSRLPTLHPRAVMSNSLRCKN